APPSPAAAQAARLGDERHRLAGRVRATLAGGPHPPAPALPDSRQDAPGCRRGRAGSDGSPTAPTMFLASMWRPGRAGAAGRVWRTVPARMGALLAARPAGAIDEA